ncbi:MAG: hypothetical protein K2L84_06100 [Muribaculaceae bacterium]|nr:hypothetical protein [Muribaculaceae bacterium]
MKIIFVISFCIFTLSLAILGMSLLDIIEPHKSLRDALGPICLLALAVSVKTYIKLKKNIR